MRHLNFCLLALFVSFSLLNFISCDHASKNEIETTRALLREMKLKHDNAWFQHFTFKQKTFFFDKNGELRDSAIWHEAVSYPGYFRIDRNISAGEYTIYRNDSTYHFKQGSLVTSLAAPATHLLFKGGLYFMSLDETMDKLVKYNYNVEAFRKDTFMNEPVYVIGDSTNQFWLHADQFYCMRRISTTEQGKQLDVIYEDFVQLGKGWVEQQVTFNFEGQKRMEEFYVDIREHGSINQRTFALDENFTWYNLYQREQ